MLRQIVIDTETTGLVPAQGHKIIEIAGVELISRRFTQNNFHVYINPERHVDFGALQVHGITNDFLVDKPKFSAIADDFLQYIDGAELIIHNAPFDIGFLNHELGLCGRDGKPINAYASIFDTLLLARKRHPGQRNSLDALCKRYGIDNSDRDLHGALKDAMLLGQVYLAMTGGQVSLFADDSLMDKDEADVVINVNNPKYTKCRKNLRVLQASSEELAEHSAYLERLEKVSGKKIWK